MIYWVEILGVLLAAAGLAFISLVEAAMVSVSPVRLRRLSEEGHPTAPLVEQLTARTQELLGGLVIMINIFVLLIANLTTVYAAQRWGAGAVIWVNLLVLAGVVIFCEITPKTISVHYAEQIALRTARIAFLLNLVLSPLITVLNGIAFALLTVLTALRILPGRVRAVPTAYSEEDIKQLVTAGEQSGEVETAEREMIHGVIEFAETTAREIMVPRTDLVALPSDAGLEEAIRTFLDSGHSRIPVYEEHVDNVVGLLYIKDLLIRLHSGEEAPALAQLLRPAYFIPESKKSDELLRELQRKRVHLAIVVDEYGGTAGLITIEDLLEEIVGDIIDEYDVERLEVAVLPDGSTMLSGRVSVEKARETFDLEEEEETEAETLSGWLTEILGRIPEVGDRVRLGDVEFTVVEVLHNRAERIRGVVLPPS